MPGTSRGTRSPKGRSTKAGSPKGRSTKARPKAPGILQVAQLLQFLRRCTKTPLTKKSKLETELLDYAKAAGMGELKIGALRKKVSRLEKICCPDRPGISNVLSAWLTPGSDADFRKALDDEAGAIEALREMDEAYERFVHVSQDTRPAITVGTTQLLSAQFWPRILPRYYTQKPSHAENSDEHVYLRIREPAELLQAARQPKTMPWDLILTYGAHSQLPPNDDGKVELTRCLIGLPDCIQGWDLGTSKEFDIDKLAERLQNTRRRMAILTKAEDIIPHFPWPELTGAKGCVDYYDSSLEMHAYAQSGCGLAITHIELLNEWAHEELAYMKAPKEGSRYGRTFLALYSRDSNNKRLHTLIEDVQQEFKRMEENQNTSDNLTEKLLGRRHSYSTRCEAGQAPKRVAWRSKIALNVTPHMVLQGKITRCGCLCGSSEPKHKEKLPFRLTGRVECTEANGHGQMILNMFDGERNATAAFFLFENSGSGLKTPGFDEPVLIGHWIGREQGQHLNTGLWILHESPKLTREDINEISKAYFKKNRAILPAGNFRGDISFLHGQYDLDPDKDGL